MSCCGVDETSGSTASKTSYQVPGILQETGWDVFTIRAEKGSIVKGICFCIYVRRFFLFFFVAVVLCASISYVVSCVGVWWRHDMYILLYILDALPALLLCTRYLAAGVSMLCLSYPVVFVFVLSNENSVAE